MQAYLYSMQVSCDPCCMVYIQAHNICVLSHKLCRVQEHAHLRNTVERIAEYKPSVLLVEKSVARYAQELLLKKGISLVLNVKRSSLLRLARCTEAQVSCHQMQTCHCIALFNTHATESHFVKLLIARFDFWKLLMFLLPGTQIIPPLTDVMSIVSIPKLSGFWSCRWHHLLKTLTTIVLLSARSLRWRCCNLQRQG